jgi:hypothetical protein
MHSKLRLGIGTGLAVTAVAAVVAGCSGGGSGTAAGGGTGGSANGSLNGSAISLVADAMDKANSAGTVKITGSMAVGGTSMTLSGDVQYSPSVKMSMSMQGGGQDISEIFLGNTIYMKDAALAAELDGKQWAEIDLDKAGGSLGALSSLANTGRNENPATQLSALVASKAVTKVGTETVQGQQTTHYSGTLNASQFLQNGAVTSQLSAAQVAELKSQLQSAGVTSETIDVWVGSNSLPVQEKVVVHSSSTGLMEMTMNLSDWGAPVDVSAPPANEVTDITAEMSAAIASASAH